MNPEPDVELTNFVTRHTIGLIGGGSSYIQHLYIPYKQVPGPAIIKVETTSNANDNDVSAGFDAILINN